MKKATFMRDAGCRSFNVMIYRPQGLNPNPKEIITDIYDLTKAYDNDSYNADSIDIVKRVISISTIYNMDDNAELMHDYDSSLPLSTKEINKLIKSRSLLSCAALQAASLTIRSVDERASRKNSLEIVGYLPLALTSKACSEGFNL